MKYLWYKKRDLLNKGVSNNVHKVPYVSSILLRSKTKNITDSQLYLLACNMTIMSEENPYLTRIHKSKDKKLVGIFTGCKVTLNKEKMLDFLLRLNQELYPLPRVKKINDTVFSLTLNLDVFKELGQFSNENIERRELQLDFSLSKEIFPSEISLVFSLWNLNTYA